MLGDKLPIDFPQTIHWNGKKKRLSIIRRISLPNKRFDGIDVFFKLERGMNLI